VLLLLQVSSYAYEYFNRVPIHVSLYSDHHLDDVERTNYKVSTTGMMRKFYKSFDALINWQVLDVHVYPHQAAKRRLLIKFLRQLNKTIRLGIKIKICRSKLYFVKVNRSARIEDLKAAINDSNLASGWRSRGGYFISQ
jgi:hypothetical protein